MSNKHILRELIKVLKAGCAVFPLAEAGKTPIYAGGCRSATRSRKQVIEHWKQHPNHNYGIATGKPFFVLDIDGGDGESSLRTLCHKNGPLPPTVQVITGNGQHLYFLAEGVLVGNSTGKLGPGIDLRGDGGYVVGVGSVHPSGHIYRYADGHDLGSMAIAPAPAWVLQLVKRPEPPEPANSPAVSNPPKGRRNHRYGQAALAGELQRLASAPLHQRNDTLNRCAFRLGQLIAAGYLSEAEVVLELEKTASAIGLDAGEIPKTIRSGMDSGKRFPRHKSPPVDPISKRPDGSHDDPLTATLAKLGCTDTDNAERFVKRCGDRFAHCPDIGWLYCDGKRWILDTRKKRVLAAIRTARHIAAEPAYLTDKSEQQQRAGHAKRSLSKAALDRMLDLAAPMMTVDITKLDADPWLFNVKNGTIDLRAGSLRRHNPRDMITKLAPVSYNPKAMAPSFIKFMRRVLKGDVALYRYLQRLVGYTLTGITTEQLFLYLRGPQSNGKSTFVNTIRDMLGDYGVHTPTQTLLVKATTTSPTTSRA